MQKLNVLLKDLAYKLTQFSSVQLKLKLQRYELRSKNK